MGPNPRNVNPTGTLADADKTKQYWFAGNSNEGGSGYNEIHVNTEVPAATGHNIMNFNKFILKPSMVTMLQFLKFRLYIQTLQILN